MLYLWKYRFAAAFAVCCAWTTAAETLPEERLLFRSSFNTTFDADFAQGESRATLAETLRRRGTQGALSLPEGGWICYPVKDNIDTDCGSILIRARPDFQPGKRKTPSYLFEFTNRYGHFLNAVVSPGGNLFINCARGTKAEQKTTLAKIDVRNWQQGEWRTILISWRKPNLLYAEIEGLGKSSSSTANLPEAPPEMLYDFYLGSKAQAIGRQDLWKGEIDEFRSYSGFVDKLPVTWPSAAGKSQAVTVEAAEPEWNTQLRYRFVFKLGKTRREWKNNPVRLRIDLGTTLGEKDLASRRKILDGMRLIASDPTTGKPLVRDGAPKSEPLFHPFQLDEDFLTRLAGDISFLHSGTLPAVYSLYFDPEPVDAEPRPAVYPLPGSGMPFMTGTKTTPGDFSGGFRSAFEAFDFDGDGDLDLLCVYGWETQSCRDLPNGLYYYENLRDKTGYDLFAPPVLVEKGRNAFGTFMQTAPPRLVDIDGDEKPEICFISQYLAAYADFEMENGVPALTNWRPIRFTDKQPQLVSSGVIADFDGDGKADIFSDGFLYRNVGTATEPLFSSKPEDPFTPESRNAKKRLIGPEGNDLHTLAWALADVDGDGKPDLVEGGVSSHIYYFPGRADGRFDRARQLRSNCGHEIDFPGIFPFPLFRDLDGDGALDLLIGNEDGAVGACYNMGIPGKAMCLAPPVHLSELNSHVNAGCISIPVVFDWDGDGKPDLISGAANGRVYCWFNKGTHLTPIFSDPQELTAGNRPIIYRAGPLGSVQGEGESEWGYTNVEVADWDGDGLPDLIISGVRGDYLFYRNIGTRTMPRLAFGEFLTVDYPAGERPVPPGFRYQPKGNELLTTTRCRPSVYDWNRDGLPDLITLDHQDRLCVFEQYQRSDGTRGLRPGKEVFEIRAPFFRSLIWNHESLAGIRPKGAGGYGRSVQQIVDYDGDGKPDLLLDNINARLLKNIGKNGTKTILVDCGDLAPQRLANHNCGPFAADLDGDGILDLIVGTEAGWIFGFLRPYLEKDTPPVQSSAVPQKK